MLHQLYVWSLGNSQGTHKRAESLSVNIVQNLLCIAVSTIIVSYATATRKFADVYTKPQRLQAQGIRMHISAKSQHSHDIYSHLMGYDMHSRDTTVLIDFL